MSDVKLSDMGTRVRCGLEGGFYSYVCALFG
jgi:hypothetical protein